MSDEIIEGQLPAPKPTGDAAVIVERIQGDHVERLELKPGDEVEFEDSWYGVRIVEVQEGAL